MKNEEIKIRQLLKKFMDGTTSVDEERAIGQWFREHPAAGSDLEDYRTMFDWFDKGMPPDTVSGATSPLPKRRRWLWTAIAVAASAALLVGMFWRNGGRERPSGGTAGPLIAMHPAPHDSTEALNRGKRGDEGNQTDTINSHINQDVKTGNGRRRHRRQRLEPAPPPRLYALTDSLGQGRTASNEAEADMAGIDESAKVITDEEAGRIITSILAAMEHDQQQQLQIISLQNQASEQEIMATLDEEVY